MTLTVFVLRVLRMEGLMWAVPDQDLSCGASEMVSDAEWGAGQGKGEFE